MFLCDTEQPEALLYSYFQIDIQVFKKGEWNWLVWDREEVVCEGVLASLFNSSRKSPQTPNTVVVSALPLEAWRPWSPRTPAPAQPTTAKAEFTKLYPQHNYRMSFVF